jgi:glutathione S-transferase
MTCCLRCEQRLSNADDLPERQSQEHMKRHPWGKVPAVTFPSGFALYESRAICKYLARKYSFPLVPQVGSSTDDFEAAALFDQAESTELLYFADPAGKIAFEMFVKKKYAGQAPNEAVVSDALRSLEAFLDVADRLLRDRDYMAGNDFSLADINYIPLMQRLFVCGYGDVIRSRKAVSAWWDRCVTRPAIQKLLAADKEAAAAAAALR